MLQNLSTIVFWPLINSSVPRCDGIIGCLSKFDVENFRRRESMVIVRLNLKILAIGRMAPWSTNGTICDNYHQIAHPITHRCQCYFHWWGVSQCTMVPKYLELMFKKVSTLKSEPSPKGGRGSGPKLLEDRFWAMAMSWGHGQDMYQQLEGVFGFINPMLALEQKIKSKKLR